MLLQISGGITNALFKLSRDGVSALVRIFGDKTELVIDRNREEVRFPILILRSLNSNWT
jgi:hypothetical protein